MRYSGVRESYRMIKKMDEELNHNNESELTELCDSRLSRWYRHLNKFAQVWEQTEATVRLVVSYFNWIWVHSRKKNVTAMRSKLAISPWSWHDLITYPTIL